MLVEQLLQSGNVEHCVRGAFVPLTSKRVAASADEIARKNTAAKMGTTTLARIVYTSMEQATGCENL
jgi:hypothetical protein